MGSEDLSSNIIRATGRLERIHCTRSALGLYGSVFVAAQYISVPSDSGHLDKGILYPALHRVIRQEPALRVAILGARVIKSAAYPAFIPCHVTDEVLDKVCLFRDDVQWGDSTKQEQGKPSGFMRFLEEQSVIQYDTEDMKIPLWRLAILHDNTVIFYYHHAIGDGKSGVAFHTMLTEALNSIDDPELAEAPFTKLFPSLESAADTSVSFWGFLTIAFEALFTSKNRLSWTANAVPSIPPSSANNAVNSSEIVELGFKLDLRLHLIEVSPEDSLKLLKICRSHSATITSTLYTVTVNTISRIVASDINIKSSAPEFTMLSTQVPVSMRPLSGMPETAICDHPSAWKAYTPLQTEFLWADAQAHARTLKSVIQPHGLAAERIGLVKFLFEDYVGFFVRQMGKKRDTTFEISNVGRFPLSKGDGDRWKVGRTIFGQGDSVCGVAIALNVIGHGTGGLSVCFSWSQSAMDDKLAKKIAEGIEEGLSELIKEGLGS